MNTIHLLTIAAHNGPVLALAGAPGGTLLASAGRDRKIKLWSIPDGELRATLDGHRGAVQSVAFSPDGRLLASGGMDLELRLWDVESGEVGQAFSEHMGALETVTFHPEGKLVACGWNMWSFGHISVWDMASGQQVTTLRSEHGQLVIDAAYNPQGDLLAAALATGFVRLWQADENYLTLRAHGEAVRSVAWSPDGRVLVSAASDGMIKLWSIPGGDLITSLKGHEGMIQRVAWLSNGTGILSGGMDGTVRLWDVESGTCYAVIPVEQSVRAVEELEENTIAAAAGHDISLWQIT